MSSVSFFVQCTFSFLNAVWVWSSPIKLLKPIWKWFSIYVYRQASSRPMDYCLVSVIRSPVSAHLISSTLCVTVKSRFSTVRACHVGLFCKIGSKPANVIAKCISLMYKSQFRSTYALGTWRNGLQAVTFSPFLNSLFIFLISWQ